MSWHILVMAQYGDLFSVMAGWNIGQRRLYGALLNKLRVDIVWRQCVGELRSHRRYTSRIGKARICGYVLKNDDTIAICITSVKLGDGDGWHPGGGSRKPDITQVEPISEARLTQHGRLWQLAHLSGDEIAAPGPVNKTVIVDNYNLPGTSRRRPERIQSHLSANSGAAYLPELFISYRQPNGSTNAPFGIRSALEWNKLTHSDISISEKSNPSKRDHPAIVALAHNSSSGSDAISPTESANNDRNAISHDRVKLASSLQTSAMCENRFIDWSLQTSSTTHLSAASDAAPVVVAQQVSTDIKLRFFRREIRSKESHPNGAT